jgi:hypothetical protein
MLFYANYCTILHAYEFMRKYQDVEFQGQDVRMAYGFGLSPDMACE